MHASPQMIQRPAPRQHVLNMISRLLRPLARLMLRHGITFYEFIEIARWVFANVAMEQFSLRNRDAWSMSKTRCAVLTGMTRRQVDRQTRLEEPDTEHARRTYHRSVRVLSAWGSEPAYQDKRGRRAELPLRGPVSFEQLVRIHCRDISARSMLDELEHRGCVIRCGRHSVRFVHDDLDATTALDENAGQLGQAAEDFMHLFEGQLTSSRTAALAHIESPLLSQDEHDELRARLQLHMEDFMKDVRREFATTSRPAREGKGKRLVVIACCGSR